jgi:hypothetical protein
MHGSYNWATFTAQTYAHLISKNDSQTQDWHADFATEDWPGYYEQCEKLEMTPLSEIYSLEG